MKFGHIVLMSYCDAYVYYVLSQMPISTNCFINGSASDFTLSLTGMYYKEQAGCENEGYWPSVRTFVFDRFSRA